LGQSSCSWSRASPSAVHSGRSDGSTVRCLSVCPVIICLFLNFNRASHHGALSRPSLKNSSLSSKNYPTDDPGAFPSREFLRQMLVGKMVQFETTRRKPQGGGGVVAATAGASGDMTAQNYYHYGHLTFENENVALRVLRNGHAKVRDDFAPPADGDANADKANNNSEMSEEELEWRKQFAQAQQEGIAASVGVHSTTVPPLVRSPKNVEDAQSLVQKVKQVTAVIEYIFDGSRFRCQITKASESEYIHSTFTCILGGVICPRSSKPAGGASFPQIAPNATPEQELVMGAKARLFVEERLLQRELTIVFHGTDKSGGAAVATVQHPRGNIAVELLKSGLGRIADWSVRLMDPTVVPPLRIAENNAKKSHLGVWAFWQAPQLSGESVIEGTCIEVVSGDTIMVLPTGTIYDSEEVLQKISLASIRSPRLGNERAGREDEPYAFECKERLRVLCAGKVVKVHINYERDIPLSPEVTDRRRFGTVSVGKRADVGEVLVQEGLATTQRHRDDDEKSPRYDDLRAAEAVAKAAKKGIHAEGEYKKVSINDLTEPKKAKAYSGSLMRSGTLKGVVEYVFNGARFKMYIPSENCYIMFSPSVLRCPQPSPSAAAAKQGKKEEPFGDAARRHARLTLLQRPVEITCSGVTNGGVITGNLWVGQGSQRHDYSMALVVAGLAKVDQRKIDYGEAPKQLVDAQYTAQANKIGLWSVEQEAEVRTVKASEKAKMKSIKVRLSEIRSGSHFFYHQVDDNSAKVMEDSMKAFTQANGTNGAPCEIKVNKVVAALFDDGNGKSWYRAKVVERVGGNKAAVLFLDHGNVATVPIATHLRPLDMSLGVDQIAPVAKEAVLALTITRPLETDEGYDAAKMLQELAWGKELTCTVFGADDKGKLAVTLMDSGDTINEELVAAGLARVAKQPAVRSLTYSMVDGSPAVELAATLNVAQERARKSRAGMWRYGDIGDEDPDEI
jgi:staphylococcal nuclease domain-containing protein 1